MEFCPDQFNFPPKKASALRYSRGRAEARKAPSWACPHHKQAFEGVEPKGKRKMNQVEKTPFEAERISDSLLSEGLLKSPDKGLLNPLLYNEVRLPRPTRRSCYKGKKLRFWNVHPSPSYLAAEPAH